MEEIEGLVQLGKGLFVLALQKPTGDLKSRRGLLMSEQKLR